MRDEISDQDVLRELFKRSHVRNYRWPGYGSLRAERDGNLWRCRFTFKLPNIELGRIEEGKTVEATYQAIAAALNALSEDEFFPAGLTFRAEGAALSYTMPAAARPGDIPYETMAWFAERAAERLGLEEVREEALFDPERYLVVDAEPFFSGPDVFPLRAQKSTGLERLVETTRPPEPAAKMCRAAELYSAAEEEVVDVAELLPPPEREPYDSIVQQLIPEDGSPREPHEDLLPAPKKTPKPEDFIPPPANRNLYK